MKRKSIHENLRTGMRGMLVLFIVMGLSVSDGSARALPGGSLNPASIPQFVDPMPIPGVMPQAPAGTGVDYEIAVRQFQQQILPTKGFQGKARLSFPLTTVWSYGSVADPTSFHYPAYTIEATADEPLKVRWINDLVDEDGNYLPHLLPVDQTLHWANPPGPPDSMGNTNPALYTGPVPIVVHLHGAHVDEHSDGYPEAWWLPDAANIDCIDVEGYPRTTDTADDFYCHGTKYSQAPGADDALGQAVYDYRNDQRATTLWFHDHSLGMTRTNVYAGPAGFYLIRGGASDIGGLPAGPYEIPIVIQDRSFNIDGSLFYPDTREFFDGFAGPYIPGTTADGDDSDVHPIWNPEFFGNTMVVNGKTWPFLNVEPRKYRFRFLNGSDSRFLVLGFNNMNLKFTVIGTDGGFLPAPVVLNKLLIGPAERFDVIVDFSRFRRGDQIILQNSGPDVPFGGFPIPVADRADPATTGKVMMFKVVPLTGTDTSTIPTAEQLLAIFSGLGEPTNGMPRQLSLNELGSEVVCVDVNNVAVSCDDPAAIDFLAPLAARLGTVEYGMPMDIAWMDPVTENPALDSIETWEIYNFTMDAHPIHVHQTMFQVMDRQALVIDPETEMPQMPVTLDGNPRGPELWESGFKDTVIAYPGEVTRIKAFFDLPGLYVWHCHILSHEDNEMMRPFYVGDCPDTICGGTPMTGM